MELYRMYTDYYNKTAITLPDTFIDVKTGETYPVSPKIQEQIEYHAKNSTLIHLLLSALNQYLHPKMVNGGMEEILIELSELKRMIEHKNYSTMIHLPSNQRNEWIDLDIKELEEVLDAFGG